MAGQEDVAVLCDRSTLASDDGKDKLQASIEEIILQYLFNLPDHGTHWSKLDAAVHEVYPWLSYHAQTERTPGGGLTEVAVFTTLAMTALVQEGKLEWRGQEGSLSAWSYLPVNQWLRMVRAKQEVTPTKSSPQCSPCCT